MAEKKRGAPKGNQNAKGNKGGGAPKGNQNARTHGLFSKHVTKETLEVYNALDGLSLLDILWDNIMLAFISIIRAQKIMHVSGKDEMIKEIKKKKRHSSGTSESSEIEWDFQFAWDRQAAFMRSQAKAQAELRNLIKQYDEMLHKDWNLAAEEQKLRVDLIKAQLDRYAGGGSDDVCDDWLDSVLGLDEGIQDSKD